MTVNDILEKAKFIAGSKTAYIKGCPGVVLTNDAKLKYTSNDPFNAKRTKMIFALPEDTSGYDEFTFFTEVTGIDCKNFGDIMSSCHDISKNFNSIVPGEILFMEGRFGIFVSGNKVIAVSPNGVGYTIAKGWVSHGKLNGVSYEEETHDNKRKVEGDTEGNAETTEENSQQQTDVEVRNDGAGSRDRVQQMSSQNKGHDRGNGRHRS